MQLTAYVRLCDAHIASSTYGPYSQGSGSCSYVFAAYGQHVNASPKRWPGGLKHTLFQRVNPLERGALMALSDSTAALGAVLAKWAQEPGGLLPALHEVQDLLGWIPPDAVVEIATAFNLSRA